MAARLSAPITTSTLYAIRNERWIGLARLTFAGVALVAIYLDPLQPALYAEIGYALLAAYLLWSVLAAWSARRLVRLGRASAIAIHAVDVVIVSVLMALTEAASSPFFVFFTFALLAAMLRWHWPAVLVTAAVVIADFLVLGFFFSPDLDLLTSILRVTYLAITAAMLGIVAANQQRLRDELARLSGRQLPLASPVLPLSQLLDYVVAVFDSPRVLLVWSDPDEPWLYFASWQEGRTASTRESPDAPLLLLPDAQADETSFLSWDLSDSKATLIMRDQVEPVDGVPLHPEFLRRFAPSTLVSAPLPTASVSGRLFIFDLPVPTVDHLLLARVVGEQIARHFDVAELMQQLQTASANEERFRLARDLHDGALQFLAGTALQLRALRQSLDRDPERARGELEKVQASLSAEQRLLRGFVDDLKPVGATRPETRELATELDTLATTLEQKWRLAIRHRIEPPDAVVSSLLYRHLQYIFSEAAANAARHGGAGKLEVDVNSNGDHLALSVADDGAGFPFTGRYDLQQLVAEERGPVMLRERVRALGGTLVLTSRETGARLEMTLPLQPES